MENITKKDLQKIYYDHTNDVAAEMLKVSKITLIDMVKRAGIEPKGKSNRLKYNIIN